MILRGLSVRLLGPCAPYQGDPLSSLHVTAMTSVCSSLSPGGRQSADWTRSHRLVLSIPQGSLARANVARTIPPSWPVPPAYLVLLGSGQEGGLLLVEGGILLPGQREQSWDPEPGLGIGL